MNLNLFSKSGAWQEPNADALAALTDPERAAVGRIREASQVLDAVNADALKNSDALKSVQVEIATLEKKLPRTTFNDLIKAQCRATALRRAGL